MFHQLKFRLLPTQFLLREGDKPVPLGSRALEILIALPERRGELVSKQDLMARVWPNVFVESANLSVHMSALRRALRPPLVAVEEWEVDAALPVDASEKLWNAPTHAEQLGKPAASVRLLRDAHERRPARLD